MSRWTHGFVTNSRRKRPLFTRLPSDPPVFMRSAYQLSRSATVVVDERDLPVPLAGSGAAAATIVPPRLGRAEAAGDQLAVRARHGAGEGRHVHEVRRAEPLGVRQRVAEDEAALGVRVDDVDRLPVEGADDVAGAGRVRPGHVLDRGGDGEERHAGREPRDRRDRGDDGAGARLVHLHLLHPVGRLDADAAGVEADALADHRRGGGPARRWRPPAPDRRTIIRGGLSLPCPTARNIPIPSSRARSGSMTSMARPLASASARASSASTWGLTSFAARFARRRATLAPSPMIRPRSAAARERRRIPADGHEDELVEGGRRVGDVVAVDGRGLEGALHARRGRRSSATAGASAVEERGERVEPDREACARTARPGGARWPAPMCRTASRSSAPASPAPTASTRADRSSPTRDDGGRVALPLELAERELAR